MYEKGSVRAEPTKMCIRDSTYTITLNGAAAEFGVSTAKLTAFGPDSITLLSLIHIFSGGSSVNNVGMEDRAAVLAGTGDVSEVDHLITEVGELARCV